MGGSSIFRLDANRRNILRMSARSLGIHVLVPMTVGTALYLLARPTGIRAFEWVEAAGLAERLAAARDVAHPWTATLPAWVTFSVPNALWVYAFTWSLCTLWGHRVTSAAAPWILGAPLLGVGWELGQALRLVRGTFDPTDLLLVSLASGLALFTPLVRPAAATDGTPP